MKEIFRIADDISVLYGGRMVASKPTSEYTLESLIEYMMGGKKNEQAMVWKDRETPIGSKNLLEIQDLSVGDRVKNVSFNIKEGEVVGLAGLMGSGRTEVLEAIFGIRKSSGSIILEGKERQFKNVRQAIESKIALVPENRRKEGLVLLHELRENLILTNLKSVKKNGLLSSRAADELGQKAIRQFNIKTDSVRTKLFNLSGGNQQKVVIAKWMNIGPRLLMLDEPTAGVDIGAKGEIIEIIRKYAAQGHGVLMVSSELSELMAVCDRVVVLRDGVKSGELTHEEMDTEEVLQRAIQK